MAHCDYCVCMTDFPPISIIESTTMFVYKHDDRDMMQTSDQVHMSL